MWGPGTGLFDLEGGELIEQAGEALVVAEVAREDGEVADRRVPARGPVGQGLARLVRGALRVGVVAEPAQRDRLHQAHLPEHLARGAARGDGVLGVVDGLLERVVAERLARRGRVPLEVARRAYGGLHLVPAELGLGHRAGPLGRRRADRALVRAPVERPTGAGRRGRGRGERRRGERHRGRRAAERGRRRREGERVPFGDGGVRLLGVVEQGVEEVLHRRVARGRVALERAVHHRDELRRQVRRAGAERLVGLRHDLAEDGGGGGALVRQVVREHLVHHRADGPDVAPVVRRREALRLLRRHVHRRAHDAPDERGALARRDLGDAEVDELGHHRRSLDGRSREEDVLRLDVAVNDAGAVRRGERAHDGHHDLDHRGGWEPVLADHAVAERLAVEQLLHDVGRAVPEPDLEHGDDVGVVRHRRRPRLAPEAGVDVGARGEVRVEHLERHAAPDPRVLRLEDDADAALPDPAQQRELAAHDHAGAERVRPDIRDLSRLRHGGLSHKGRRSKAKAHVSSTPSQGGSMHREPRRSRGGMHREPRRSRGGMLQRPWTADRSSW